MKTFLRKLIVKIMYVVWSIGRINKPHIGDIVKIKTSGKRFFLIQGVSSPYWDLHNHIDGRVNKVHESEFKLANPIKGRIERFKSSYKFQISNWYRIDFFNKSLFKRISFRS